MSTVHAFDAALIERYDYPGPRYTSYPTALQFGPEFGDAAYREERPKDQWYMVHDRLNARLRTLTVEHKSACDTCFCRWSCAGECAAKLALAGDAWNTGENPRCIINRELTLDQMKEWLDHDGACP